MASLIYAAIASLDGHVEDEQGNFDWAVLDEDVHRFLNICTGDACTRRWSTGRPAEMNAAP
jgi:hypothetical protein